MQIAAADPVECVDVHQQARVRSFNIDLIKLAIMVICTVIVVSLDAPPRPMPSTIPPSAFSAERAARHLSIIGAAPHPPGSIQHDVVRDYIVSALRGIGL